MGSEMSLPFLMFDRVMLSAGNLFFRGHPGCNAYDTNVNVRQSAMKIGVLNGVWISR